MSDTSNKELYPLIDKLVDKLTELYHYFNEYNVIFNEDTSTKKVLESTHSIFWEDLYWLYWNFLTIRICNLMDRSETFKNQNLSFYQLLEQIKFRQLDCEDSVINILNEIESRISPFRKARKKAFAHFDLDLMLSKDSLVMLSLDDINWILAKFTVIVNTVNNDLKRDTLLFGLNRFDGAKRLINILKMGVEYRDNLGKKQ